MKQPNKERGVSSLIEQSKKSLKEYLKNMLAARASRRGFERRRKAAEQRAREEFFKEHGRWPKKDEFMVFYNE